MTVVSNACMALLFKDIGMTSLIRFWRQAADDPQRPDVLFLAGTPSR